MGRSRLPPLLRTCEPTTSINGVLEWNESTMASSIDRRLARHSGRSSTENARTPDGDVISAMAITRSEHGHAMIEAQSEAVDLGTLKK